MIQPNELRIGNFVYQSLTDMTESIYHSIRSIGEKCVSTNELNEIVPFNKLDGIPLTSEILEKCGFSYDRNYGYNISLVKLSKRLNIPFDSMYNARLIRKYYNGFMTISENIKYLHQLQNLYFILTGEELTVNI